MPVRLIEIFVPLNRVELARSSVSSLDVLSIWWEKLADEQAQLHILVEAERSEEVTDMLRTVLADSGAELKIVSLPVEMSIPAPGEEDTGSRESGRKRGKPSRVSREELITDVDGMMRTSVPNLVMTVLSAVVCAIGLSGSDVAVIIGAMVIAPLLGPNVGLSLSVTLGDFGFFGKALKENILRIGTAFLFVFGMGRLFAFDVDAAEIVSRTTVESTDIVVALAAGAAGALALSTGASSTLIGVMMATALMPPLVVTGILAAAGEFSGAVGAARFLAVNLISINLSGIVTFLAVGVRPWSRLEASRARMLVALALVFWLLLLAWLASLMVAR